VTPGEALSSLRTTLAGSGLTTVGMTLTRYAGTLFPADGPCIGYHYGFFWWPTGRSRRGRPLYAIHDASDPAGAARRLTRLDDAERDTLRQALEDAIALRARIAAEPCPDCETHAAMLCPGHAAELDWVSLYRGLAGDLRIEAKPA
jgi:hypothetical protein